MSAASSGRTGIGVQLKYSDGGSPATFVTVANVTQLSAGGITLNTADATQLDSPNFYMENLPTLKKAEEWTFTLQWNPSEVSHAGTSGLRYVLEQRALRQFQMNTSALGMTLGIEIYGYVTSLGNIEVTPDGIMTQSCTITPSGPAYEITN